MTHKEKPCVCVTCGETFDMHKELVDHKNTAHCMDQEDEVGESVTVNVSIIETETLTTIASETSVRSDPQCSSRLMKNKANKF